MRKTILSLLLAMLFTVPSFAGDNDSLQIEEELQAKFVDSIEHSLKWDSTSVTIGKGLAIINISKGFKFLNAEQSKFVLHNIWGNPERDDILGMIFPDTSSPFDAGSFVFIISFEEDGFVKDDDADKIDYNDLFNEMKKLEPGTNKEREKQGYEPIKMIGWASTPYYDKKGKVLHWARELQFGNNEEHTLNYDVRVLGRKGILSLNAIASIHNLDLVKNNIDKVLAMPEFTAGNRYSDFDESSDKIAEYGLGALVAGGILAKTGGLALIGKFFLAAWKFILIGIVALWGTIKKFFGKKKEETGEFVTATEEITTNDEQPVS
jgi:uncharacterized membrane-anchored protein